MADADTSPPPSPAGGGTDGGSGPMIQFQQLQVRGVCVNNNKKGSGAHAF
jgi:hypothetical protein